MEPVLSDKITSLAAIFSRLEEVVVSLPTMVEQFPHPSSIPNLKLLSIPSHCTDWQWLEHVQGLTELDVSIGGTETEANSGSLWVCANIGKLKSTVDAKTVCTLGKVLSHLPLTLRNIEASITGSDSRLTVEGNKAVLTNVSDTDTTEVVTALANILFSIPIKPPNREVSIGGSGTLGYPGCLNMSGDRAVLTSLADAKTVKVLRTLINNVPTKLTELNVLITGRGSNHGRLSVNDEKAQLTSTEDTETVGALADILYHLPMDPSVFDIMITGYGLLPGHLDINGDQATLTTLADIKMAEALAILLGSVRTNVTNLDAIIMGCPTDKGHLVVNADNAELTIVADDEAVEVMVIVLSHLPLRLSTLDASITGNVKLPNQGRVMVNADKAELTSLANSEQVAALTKILFRLPIIFSKLDASITGSGQNTGPGRFIFETDEAELTSAADTETVAALAIILSHLPESLSKLDVSITGSGPNPGRLVVETDKAKFTSVTDTETVTALSIILSHLPVSLSKLDVSITGSGPTPGCIEVNADKAELTSAADSETITALANVLSHLVLNLSKLDVLISGKGRNQGFLCISDNEAELTKIKEEEISLAVAKVVGNLPENLRKKVRCILPYFGKRKQVTYHPNLSY